MEKLELKHLAPYLPYGLELRIASPFGVQKRIFELDCGHDFKLHLSRNDVKLVLRPLSDLTKEIEHNGERFIPMEKLKERNIENIYHHESQIWIDENNRGASYVDLGVFGISLIRDKCVEWKFDVFGLIEKEFAIDVNTLETNPYS